MTLKEVAYDWLGWNQQLFLFINGTLPSGLRTLPRLGSALGNYWAAPLPVAILLWCSRRAADEPQRARLRHQAYVFVASFLLAFALAALVKWGLDLPRPAAAMGAVVRLLVPEEDGHSFPSGHSVYAFLLASALWPLAAGPTRILLVACVPWVGYSRIALGAHFPSDVAGGWLLALACACAVRFFLPQSPEAPGRTANFSASSKEQQ